MPHPDVERLSRGCAAYPTDCLIVTAGNVTNGPAQARRANDRCGSTRKGSERANVVRFSRRADMGGPHVHDAARGATTLPVPGSARGPVAAADTPPVMRSPPGTAAGRSGRFLRFMA